MRPHVLVACVGNLFLGDDAFGVEVARRLANRPRPDGVRVVDFGIRGFDLALALLDEAIEVVILVDAVSRGEAPGTLFVIEPEWDGVSGSDSDHGLPIETHALDPVKVLRLVLALGGRPKPVLLVGCEPSPPIDREDPAMELSTPVEEAVGEAVLLVESLVAQILEDRGVGFAQSMASQSRPAPLRRDG